jgi:acetyl-CoA acetyltransferase
MRDVAVVSFAQSPSVRSDTRRNETEILMPVVAEAIERSGIDRHNFGFVISGSSDYLAGQPFAFVMALDAIGAWPPVAESHVEMDGAWALYEAWVRLQHGDIDTALVYAFGKSSLGDLRDVLALQLDPYLVTPLWPDSISVAALQARAMLDSRRCSERDMAEVAVRSRRDAASNSHAQVRAPLSIDDALASKHVVSPLRVSDCPPMSDGAAVIVLAAGDAARKACPRPAWISGIDHRIEPASLGARDLTRSPSTALAAAKAGLRNGGGAVDIAEIHAPFTHQEIIVRDALGFAGEGGIAINPSGGALCANPVMVAGLIRIGEAAQRIIDGDAKRAVAHATSGPCLQQNLVCVMEAR